LEAERDRLRKALKPFAACADELDYDTEATGREYPDDEWAKFRLIVSDYRNARAALRNEEGRAMTDAPKGSNADELSALTPSTPAPVVPKVKPLVWYDPMRSANPSHCPSVASTAFSNYYANDHRFWLDGHEHTNCESRQAAKAAAQADHEDRVLSQIDMAPVTVQEAARVLRDAPELMEGWSEDAWADICALAEQEGE